MSHFIIEPAIMIMKMSEFGFLESDSGEMQSPMVMKIRTLRESIYYYLREAIIKQEIKPNARIQEKDIANKFGVSTTPVREAFLKLHAEGYININAHRSVTVKPISHSELTEIYQVISVLDGFAANLALKMMDRNFLKRLQALTNEMEDFCKKEMVEEYLRLNTSIHSLIWEQASNVHLKITLYNIQNQMLRYHKERLSFYSLQGMIRKSMESHKKILNAFKTSDSEKIERIVRSHWNISGIIP